MRRRVRTALPILILLSVLAMTRSGSADAPLRPGLRLEYSMEIMSEGQVREERLTLELGERTETGLWRLELRLGEDGSATRYRALYDDEGAGSPFLAKRFSEVASWEGDWIPVAARDLELLDLLRNMETRLRPSASAPDSTFSIDGRLFSCRRHALSDSSETAQEGESVSLRRIQTIKGEAWVTDELPFGGWVVYREERRARKISEFAGRRFEGREELSVETWRLVSASTSD